MLTTSRANQSLVPSLAKGLLCVFSVFAPHPFLNHLVDPLPLSAVVHPDRGHGCVEVLVRCAGVVQPAVVLQGHGVLSQELGEGTGKGNVLVALREFEKGNAAAAVHSILVSLT